MVITYNLEGSPKLKLDGPTIAEIYMGKITKWDDTRLPAKIRKLRSRAPIKDIVVVHRSDGRVRPSFSPTISPKVSPQWKEKIGSDTAVQWPVGIGGKGNEGVANMSTLTDGSIGYVEYAYAKQNKMPYAAMINESGKRVEPKIETFQAAASNADWVEHRLCRHPDQRTRAGKLADHRRELHSDAPEAASIRRRRKRR